MHGNTAKQKNPYIISLHWIAHKLALVASQAADSIDYMKNILNACQLFIHFFSHFPNRMSHLKEIQDVVDDPKLSVKQIHTVRWLSMKTAVNTILRTIKSLNMCREEAAQGDPTAIGLSRELPSFAFITMTCLLSDSLI